MTKKNKSDLFDRNGEFTKKKKKKKSGERIDAPQLSGLQSLSLVSTAHSQLYKSPQRTGQSKFLSIHPPPCQQADTQSSLEINASVNGFALPLRFATGDQTPLEWRGCRADAGGVVGKKKVQTSPFMMNLAVNQLQVSSIQSLVMRNRGEVVASVVKNQSPCRAKMTCAREDGKLMEKFSRILNSDEALLTNKKHLFAFFCYVYLKGESRRLLRPINGV